MRPPANHRERCISREIMKLELREAKRRVQTPQPRSWDEREPSRRPLNRRS